MPFLVRMADLGALASEMSRNGVEWQDCRPIGVIDPNRVPVRLRSLATALNRVWFRCRLPFAAGVVVIGRKT